MMRKAVIYLAVIAIVVGAVPFFFGKMVEPKFKDVIQVLSEVDNSPLVLKTTEYNSGWLTSHAKTAVIVPTHQANYNFTIEHVIHHGPFVQMKKGNLKDWRFARAVIDSNLVLTEEAKKILIQELGDDKLFNVVSEIKMDGSVDINATGEPKTLKEHAGTTRVAWKGLQGNWHLSQDLKHFKGELVIPGFDFDLGTLRIYAVDLIYKTELFKTPEGLWPGKTLFNVDTFNLLNSEKRLAISLNKIAAGGLMEVEGHMVDFSGTLNIEKAVVNNEPFGPIVYSSSLKNIESQVAKSFFQLSQKLRDSTPQEKSEQVKNLMSLTSELLKSRPEFHVEQLKILTQQGEINGQMSLAVGGPQAADINNVGQVIQSIIANAKVSLPKEMVNSLLIAYNAKVLQTANEITKQMNQIKRNQAQAQAQTQTEAPQTQDPNAAPDTQTPASTELKEYTDEEIIQKATQQMNETVAQWIQQGMVVDQQQSYLIAIEVKNGQVTINGRPAQFPPSQIALPQ